jgi:hypothetical protein
LLFLGVRLQGCRRGRLVLPLRGPQEEVTANWFEITAIQVKMEVETKTFDVGVCCWLPFAWALLACAAVPPPPSPCQNRHARPRGTRSPVGLVVGVVGAAQHRGARRTFPPSPFPLHLCAHRPCSETIADSSETLPARLKLRASPLDLALVDTVDLDQAYSWWSYRDIISWSCPLPNELHLSIVRWFACRIR